MSETWERVALPVLRWISEYEGIGSVSVGELANELALDPWEVANELDRLTNENYIAGDFTKTGTGGDPRPWFAPKRLGANGARAVGMWPSGNTGDVLLDVLRALEESTPDPDQKTRLKRAADALGGMTRDLLVDLGASFLKQAAGLP